jgi:ankyrin repeat protein
MNISSLLIEYSELPEFDCPISSVDQKGRWNSAPLHIAVHRKCFLEAKTLLEAGADPNMAGEFGERPIQIAIRRNLFDVVELLLSAGANCDLCDDHGTNAWNDAESVGATDKLKNLVRNFPQPSKN